MLILDLRLIIGFPLWCLGRKGTILVVKSAGRHTVGFNAGLRGANLITNAVAVKCRNPPFVYLACILTRSYIPA